MKWLYFGLAVFSGCSAVLIALYADPKEKSELLRPCIIGAVVNLAVFFVMGWAKKKGERRMKEQAPKAKV